MLSKEKERKGSPLYLCLAAQLSQQDSAEILMISRIMRFKLSLLVLIFSGCLNQANSSTQELLDWQARFKINLRPEGGTDKGAEYCMLKVGNPSQDSPPLGTLGDHQKFLK